MAKKAEKPGPREAHNPEPQTAQRAYTLRLRGIDPNNTSWRGALWTTHEAVNKGAKFFGDWLLTLRGGLSHELAEPPPVRKGKEGSGEEAVVLRKNRRILLALSWLSVEDDRGAPGHLSRVAKGSDGDAVRQEKLTAALRTILDNRGLTKRDIDSWIVDCTDPLSARIRPDAVWINRSEAFDAAMKEIGSSLTRDEAWDLLGPFFASKEAYLAQVELADDDETPREKAKDLVQKAGQWLSSRFGTGTGADFESMAAVYAAMAKWSDLPRAFRSGDDALADLVECLAPFRPEATNAEGILSLISGPGYKSATRNIIKAWGERPEGVSPDDVNRLGEAAAADDAKCRENIGAKGRRPWSDTILENVQNACGFTYLQESGPSRHSEFAVMLDHAARRVSIAHSWIKRAEAERRRFEVDARRLNAVPADAAARLDQYVKDRTGAAGGEYRIRRRAIEGWDGVVKRWNRIASANDAELEQLAAEVSIERSDGVERSLAERARIGAARLAQADDEDGKFGDIQLFEALAPDDAVCVWRRDEADPQPLKDYVLGHDARFRQRQFKVPAYRHPDPLRHPVFGDFGNSRWKVAYAALEAAKAAHAGRRIGARDAMWVKDPRALRLGLWDGERVRDVDLRWRSKRLSADLALGEDADDAAGRKTSRADRLGRAASGLRSSEAASVAGVFAQDDWSARLQAPRRELDALARRVEKHGWDARAQRMRSRLSWLVTFSAKLECRGPFIEYAARNGIVANRKGEYYPNSDSNKAEKRQGHAKLGLSRLPALRLLSVDLGHRFAAACAVWETITAADMCRECRRYGRAEPGSGELFIHLTRMAEKEVRRGRDKGKVKSIPETTIYRRIGEDFLRDPNTGNVTTTPHPAPWARLDRQFLIKLQGEEKPARMASPAEREYVERLEAGLGRVRGPDEPLPWAVDALMSEAVRTVRLALRRHGDAARIAYAFMPESKRHTPGGGAAEHTAETRTESLLDALVRWNEVRGRGEGAPWRDAGAAAAWASMIQPRLAQALPTIPMEASGQERKRHRAEVQAALGGIAGSFGTAGPAGTQEIFDWWQRKWQSDDGAWGPRLRELRQWLTPRGLARRSSETEEHRARRKARLAGARNVGGLSLTRIATIRELYQVQKAYRYKPEPSNPRAGIALIESDSARGYKFGDRTLQAMERMREQRVKQVASRIAASALGLGGHWKDIERRDGSGKVLLGDDGNPLFKPVWIEERDAKYPPCHAVVIENLRNYRPEEIQTRRENRALMSWSAGKIRKYLEEACQLHGLHLREVMPNYTSRQCSRTGAPGVRCTDVPVDKATGEPRAFWWGRAVLAAQKKVDGGSEDAESKFLVDLAEHLRALHEAGEEPATVRVPRRGGDLFVAAGTWGMHGSKSIDTAGPGDQSRAAIQADLNAAANIGLRALLDPDFPGRWWYVPCDSATGMPTKDKCAGAACVDLNTALLAPAGESSPRKKRGGKSGEKANAWRDPGCTELAGQGWLPHGAYWRWVQGRVVERLCIANGLSAPTQADTVALPETPW